jgi:hypothetical protein
MNTYLYQNWLRSYKEQHNEEDTLWYYADMYKPKYDPNLGDIAAQKKANKFLKTCTSSKEWAKFAYEHDLEFCVCKMDGHLTEAYLSQDNIKDITVAFLDEDDDVFMYYAFKRENNGQYFLFAMVFWEWTDHKKDRNDYKTFWKYLFEPNGNVKVIEREKDAEEECVWTSKQPLNVESNWEERPQFGDWDGFFKMKRWADGALDEAFKGQNITTYIKTAAGTTIAKTNQPYNFLAVAKQEEIAIALAKAQDYHKQGEKDKVFKVLQKAYNDLPKPKENYEATSQLILEVIKYHNLYNEHTEALDLLEKLEKYLNADTYFLLPLYKAKTYFNAKDKQSAKNHFNAFIKAKGLDVLVKDYPDYYEIYQKI